MGSAPSSTEGCQESARKRAARTSPLGVTPTTNPLPAGIASTWVGSGGKLGVQ
ncbi:MAG: hypothetical protein ABI335_25615 [Polyangiaceae bacterium]